VNEQPQSPAILRELQHRLAGAQDGLIERIVAMVDALPERGAADRLIAPLRPRLAQLRPARPLRFCRLLFLPLDPLIVPGPKWRPMSLTIPRTVLEPLAVSVLDAMRPDARAAVEAVIAGRTTRDIETVRKAGALLWPAAGRILCAAPASRTWHTTELPVAEHPALARGVGGGSSCKGPRCGSWPMRPGAWAVPTRTSWRRCFEAPRFMDPRRSAA
jgi:hypothetical protein